jgi:transposase
MLVIDTDIRERLEFIPAKFLVHELHYLKRACGKCKETVTVAPQQASDHQAASPTKGSRYGFGVIAQIILGKFCDHLPLYRMEDVFARAGVMIPRSTHVDLLAASADLVHPLTELMKSHVLASHIVGRDDTSVQLRDNSLPGKMRTARMYTITASGHRHNPDLWLYLDDVLRGLAGGSADLESLLPDAWAKAHPENVRTYRQQESLARATETKARRARRRKLNRR